MSKISKIANKGIQYDIGGSGDDDIRLVNLDRGFLLLKKVCPGIVIAFLNTSVNNSDIKASGDFAGFEGYTTMVLGTSSGREDIKVKLYVSRASIRISFSLSAFANPGTSCAGIYRVESAE